MNILLDEQDFKKLCRGEIISFGGDNVMLADIGYHRMLQAIIDSMKTSDDVTIFYAEELQEIVNHMAVVLYTWDNNFNKDKK